MEKGDCSNLNEKVANKKKNTIFIYILLILMCLLNFKFNFAVASYLLYSILLYYIVYVYYCHYDQC